MAYILRTNQLCKCFGEQEVIKNVSLNIKKGEIYGFLGPNGAGKSTVMKMIMNLTQPTSGSIEVFGEDRSQMGIEALKRMSAIIENPIFYNKLTAKENLELHCEYMGYHNMKDIDKVLEMVKLTKIEKKAVAHFSLGMKQRLALARAVVTKPELLILDEPINGLDPEGIVEIRNMIKMFSKEYGITVMISSHILSEMEQISDTVGIICEGRMMKEVDMQSIHNMQADFVEVQVDDTKKSACALENALGIKNMKIIDQELIRIYDSSISINSISKALMLADICIKSISQKKNSLEEYFLKLTRGGELHV